MKQQTTQSIPVLTITETLLAMGDYLDGIDDVRERNDAGFNRFDKQAWPGRRGRTAGMQKLLAKYTRQLTERFGAEACECLTAKLPEPVPTCQLSPRGLEIICQVCDIPSEKFQQLLQVLRSTGFFYVGVWTGSAKDVDIVQFEADLAHLGLTISGDLEGCRAAAAQQAKLKLPKAFDRFKTVTVTRLEDGKFAFTAPYSPEFNRIFSNKSGVLSGITEYNPSNHARETYQIELVQEAIRKIGELMPGWKIHQVGVQEAWGEYLLAQEALANPIPEVACHLADGIALFPYQNQMVRFLQESNGRAICGDEMGLGKTLQSLAYAVSRDIQRILVICPKVVRRTWLQEASRFFPQAFTKANSLELSPKLLKAKQWPVTQAPRIATVNYESLGKFQEFIDCWGPQLVIIDESHRIKNHKTLAYQDTARVAKRASHVLELSGTCVKNKKQELFTQVDLVRPGLFVNPEELQMGTIGGTWNKLRKCYLARQKRQVLKDLPDKLHLVVKVEVSGIEAIPMPESFEEIAGIKAEIARAKVPQTIEYIEELLANGDANCLVFSDTVDAAKQIAEALGSQAILHHGQMTDDAREQAKADFQAGKARVFSSTRQSLAVGATMTRANYVIFNDLPWTIADVSQAEDRAHRIGQTDTVNVVWIIADNHKWDRYTARILARKQDLCKKMNQGLQLTEVERAFIEKAVALPESKEELEVA